MAENVGSKYKEAAAFILENIEFPVDKSSIYEMLENEDISGDFSRCTIDRAVRHLLHEGEIVCETYESLREDTYFSRLPNGKNPSERILFPKTDGKELNKIKLNYAEEVLR